MSGNESTEYFIYDIYSKNLYINKTIVLHSLEKNFLCQFYILKLKKNKME